MRNECICVRFARKWRPRDISVHLLPTFLVIGMDFTADRDTREEEIPQDAEK